MVWLRAGRIYFARSSDASQTAGDGLESRRNRRVSDRSRGRSRGRSRSADRARTGRSPEGSVGARRRSQWGVDRESVCPLSRHVRRRDRFAVDFDRLPAREPPERRPSGTPRLAASSGSNAVSRAITAPSVMSTVSYPRSNTPARSATRVVVSGRHLVVSERDRPGRSRSGLLGVEGDRVRLHGHAGRVRVHALCPREQVFREAPDADRVG